MRLHIYKKTERGKYIYKIREVNNIACYRRFTFGVLFERIYLDDSKLELKQVSYFLRFISRLSIYGILPIDPFPQLILYEGHIKKGGVYSYFFSSNRKVKIGKNVYELYLHRDNYISVMKNESQIALMKRECFTAAEETEYEIDFDPAMENDINLILMLVAFADSTYFKNRLKWSFAKYEKSVGKNAFDERLKWQSNK